MTRVNETARHKKTKTFDAVEFMRQQRDKLSENLSKMTKDEIIAYFKKRKAELTIKPSA